MDGLTVLTNPTEYAENSVATGAYKEIFKIKAMMNQLADSVTAQSATVATLNTKMNGVSSRAGKTIDKKKASPGLHVCVYCKRKLYQKGGNCLELVSNKAKRYPGWNSVFAKE